MTYSLLLHHLAPKPSREQLEELTKQVASIARQDATRILNGWYGIVESSLTLTDALSFQNALLSIGCNSHVVSDSDVPALHTDFRCQKIEIQESKLVLTDFMGREQTRLLEDLVFVSAGFLNRQRAVNHSITRNLIKYSQYGTYSINEAESVLRLEEKFYFRIDLFFTHPPHRISYELETNSVLLHGEQRIRIHHLDLLNELTDRLKSLVPEARTNHALRNFSSHPTYPSLVDYEEEIRWAFYMLSTKK